MADFLAVLSQVHRDNWAICKRDELWGAGRSGVGAAHAKKVAPADRLFVWAAGEGLLATAEITGRARRVRSASEVPWPDPDRYGWVFPIRVVAELDVAYVDEFRDGRGGNRTSRRLGLKGWQVQSGFAELEDPQGAACAAVFRLGQQDAEVAEAIHPARREGAAAAVFLGADSDVATALLTLYRQRDLCAVGETPRGRRGSPPRGCSHGAGTGTLHRAGRLCAVLHAVRARGRAPATTRGTSVNRADSTLAQSNGGWG